MRIAVISVHGCPCIQPGGTDAGGMNVYVDQVAHRLESLGDAVVVYSRTHPGIENDIESLGYQLVHVPVGEITLPKDRIPETLSDFTTAVESDAVVNNRTFDLVTSHYWLSGVVGCELARSWTVPHVTSFHTLASIKKRVRPEEDEPKIRFVNEARAARESDVVIAWTEGEAEHITREFDVPTDKIVIVPPGVDTERFVSSPTSSDTRARKRILYVGRLDALKGVDLLIEAFALVVGRGVDAELQIVGGGSADEFRRVLGRISQLRLTDRVKLPGVLPQSELPEIYSNSDCIVAPSFHETFGLAVLEAAACATPAIAADVDGLRAIVVDGDTGYLVRERDAQLYADKIVELMGNDTLRVEMSKAARKRAETLSWDATVSGLVDIYNRIAKPRLSTVALR
ncbi:MAG: glycosyltransferase family 1 protein [Chloroflexi bacterium]|nr:glycosyltransferase family 1 protein [Chloroflexota bacterium]